VPRTARADAAARYLADLWRGLEAHERSSGIAYAVLENLACEDLEAQLAW
jgi:hypothetical protein